MVSVQFEVWRNGRLVVVKEETFETDEAMAKFFDRAEADGRDLVPLRYVDEGDTVSADCSCSRGGSAAFCECRRS